VAIFAWKMFKSHTESWSAEDTEMKHKMNVITELDYIGMFLTQHYNHLSSCKHTSIIRPDYIMSSSDKLWLWLRASSPLPPGIAAHEVSVLCRALYYSYSIDLQLCSSLRLTLVLYQNDSRYILCGLDRRIAPWLEFLRFSRKNCRQTGVGWLKWTNLQFFRCYRLTFVSFSNEVDIIVHYYDTPFRIAAHNATFNLKCDFRTM